MREVKSSHKIDGFTPLFDVLVQRYGLPTAAVYGRVWRFSQMRDGLCYASVERIAHDIGVSKKTVRRRLATLCEDGFLLDSTPDLRNKPHRFYLTGKLDLEHVSETRAVSSSLVRESNEESSGEDKDSVDSLTNPSVDSLTNPSVDSLTNEDTEETIRNNNTIAAVALSDDQRLALDALREIGFVPDSDAVRFAREVPEKTLGWTGYARREGLGGGFVRQRLAGGDDPPIVEERPPQSTGEVWR